MRLVVYAASWMPIWKWIEKTAAALEERGVEVVVREPTEAEEDIVVLPTYVVFDTGGSERSRVSGAQSLSDLEELCFS